jgi:Uma2 family endonuclease
MTTIRPAWGEIYRVSPSTSADELVRLPDDGYRYELYEGVVLREMTSPGHADICQRLGVELGIYARSTAYPHRILQAVRFLLDG